MKQMKVGVIGAGAISDIYLKNMIHRFDALEVVSIASAHRVNAEKKAAEYGLRACTVAEMMEDSSVGMVVVLTPVGSHEALIRDALFHGKHVYTEKTLTDAPESALGLLRLAEEKGLYLGSAPDTFLGAAWQTARKALDEGMLGEIHSFAISATRCNDRLLSLYTFLREPGCGILYDYAVYYVTALVSLLGPVGRAAAITAAPYPEHRGIIEGKPDFGKTFASPNESQVSAILRMRSGVTGTLHIDADTVVSDEAYFTIYGTKGYLKLTDPNQFGGDVLFCPTHNDRWAPLEYRKLEPVSDLSDNCRGIGPQEMALAIREGRPNRANKEMAYHVLEVLSALLAGGKDGTFLEIQSTCQRPERFS